MNSQKDLLHRYRLLLDITKNLASTLDLDSLLDRIASAAADLSTAQVTAILLYDENKKELYCQTVAGGAGTYRPCEVIPVEESLPGWVIFNGEPRILSDEFELAALGAFTRSLSDAICSVLAVPMQVQERRIGVLMAVKERSAPFNQDDLDLMMALGAQAAVAIVNTRLFQQSDHIAELLHELRTPMTSLNTAARLLNRKDMSEEVRREIIDLIISETSRLSKISTDFLDMARLESGRTTYSMEVVDPYALVRECVSLMSYQARKKEVELRFELENGTAQAARLYADPEKIMRVILNLLSNAIKYTPPGERIDVRTGVSENYWRLEVEDCGIGIPAESLPHLFEKFYRVPGTEKVSSGTGLGLSISQRLVEAHGGRIEVESQEKVGSTFRVFLPLYTAA